MSFYHENTHPLAGHKTGPHTLPPRVPPGPASLYLDAFTAGTLVALPVDGMSPNHAAPLAGLTVSAVLSTNVAVGEPKALPVPSMSAAAAAAAHAHGYVQARRVSAMRAG